MSQSCQNNRLACLFDLTSQENLIQDSVNLQCLSFDIQMFIAVNHQPNETHLVEVEDQIKLAHVSEERIQNLDEEVYRLQVCQFVIVCVDACAEEQPSVSSVHYLGHISELNEIRLVLLVAGRNEAVDLQESDAARVCMC